LPGDGFSHKSKYVASNKTDKTLVVINALYLPSAKKLYVLILGTGSEKAMLRNANKLKVV
jgi:hypothetical protein